MKQKKLNIELRPSDYNYLLQERCSFKEPLFFFVSPPDKTGYMKAQVDITYCRESVCEYIRQDLRNITDYNINTHKLHLIIYRRVVKTPSKLDKNLVLFENQVLSGQTMVNAIEKNYGWPLTKVHTVRMCTNQPGIPPYNAFYYIMAGKRWLKAPAMLSLFTLLFRIAVEGNKFRFRDRIKDIDTLYSVLEETSKKSNSCDMAYFREHGEYWPMVLDNYRKLFANREMADLYYPGGGHDYFFSEGINRLCDMDSKDSELNNVFHRIVRKANRC
jgi:hypothetical protein